MAKINLTNQHNQEENLRGVAALGVLICMVVTFIGIKLWWFKHRLSFEQSSTQNGAAGGSTPPIIVPRRSKQQKYKKDKRYSQQIYESVEVHGIFRQKREDDLEIQQPEQLPPKSTSLILPSRRNKIREQVHSTAFEDLEIATPPITTTSSSDLTAIPEHNTKISLTFEEFERQFKLKDITPDALEPSTLNNEFIEIPVPPLRLNRSSSAMTRPEKTQHFLKSSQSVTIPEFRKILEKRQNQSVSRPTEDLTKFDDYDETKLFETFGERRPTGYIKCEEVDRDLQEQYEKELNAEAYKEDHHFTVADNSECPKVEPALKALRNEHIVYNNDLNESPEVQFAEVHKFNKNSFKLNELADVEQNENYFVNHIAEIKQTSSEKCMSLNDVYCEDTEVFAAKYQSVKDQSPTESPSKIGAIKESRPAKSAENEIDSLKKQRPREFVKDYQTNELQHTALIPSIKKIRSTELFKEPGILKKEFQSPTDIAQNSQNIEMEAYIDPQISKQYVPECRSVNEQKINEVVKEANIVKKTNENFNIDSSSLQEDFDNSWPQFEEKIETPEVIVRRFKNQGLEPQISFDETDDFTTTRVNKNSSIYFNVMETTNEANEKCTLNQRRPTGYVRDWPDMSDSENMKDWQEDFNNKLYNQVRSFITTVNFTNLGNREVTFDSLSDQNSDNENQYNNSAIKQRRPTGFVRRNEYSVSYADDDSDEDSKPRLPSNQRNSTGNIHSNVEIVEIQTQVNYKDNDEIENSTLQQRQAGFLKPQNNDEIWSDINSQEDSNNCSKTQVKFNATTNFKEQQEASNYDIKQRRPTGYIRNTEIMNLRDLRGLNKEISKEDDLENKEITHNSETVGFKKEEQSFSNYGHNTEALLTQGGPTSFVRKAELDQVEKQVHFQLNNEKNEILSTKGNKALNQRRPTGFIRIEEITKQVNFNLNIDSDKDDKPEFGNKELYVEKKELKCLDQPAPVHHPSYDDNCNTNFDDSLWKQMEEDVEQDLSSNFEAEFAKIRHSYELNEADFLEIKSKQQNSPTPAGFGKSIEDDWDNFENLKALNNTKVLHSSQEINMNICEAEMVAKKAMLKEHKLEEIQPKPRKSKVTFDFKTDECVIPGRKNHNYSEEDTDDDAYDKRPPPIPPSTISYNIEATLTPIVPIPTTISLFGSPISQDEKIEDSWSAIRKHRDLTVEFQNLSIDYKPSPPSSAFNTPPKPSYRNPMAQLAIQRAKEVRAEMDGYKPRSITNKKTEGSKRQKLKIINFSNEDYRGTEA